MWTTKKVDDWFNVHLWSVEIFVKLFCLPAQVTFSDFSDLCLSKPQQMWCICPKHMFSRQRQTGPSLWSPHCSDIPFIIDIQCTELERQSVFRFKISKYYLTSNLYYRRTETCSCKRAHIFEVLHLCKVGGINELG